MAEIRGGETGARKVPQKGPAWGIASSPAHEVCQVDDALACGRNALPPRKTEHRALGLARSLCPGAGSVRDMVMLSAASGGLLFSDRDTHLGGG
jgi:hypothetical protein